MSDLIRRSDAVVAIANLHVSHDREEIFKAYAKNPHSMTTDFEGTLIDAINAVEALPSADRPQGEWDRGFYEFLWNVILPNDMQKYIEMYEAQPVAVDGVHMKGADDDR